MVSRFIRIGLLLKQEDSIITLEERKERAARKLLRKEHWKDARSFLRLCHRADDLDAFAADFVEMFPDCPPDAFDFIASNGERFYNGSSRKWKIAKEATSPTGWATRLESQVPKLIFVSALPKHFGLGEEYADYRHYHDKSFINDWREAIKEQVEPPYWWRSEVGVNGYVHPHILCAEGAFDALGVWKDVYDLERLVRYLKKGIPYTSENLAVYLKAYVARKAKGIFRGPNHSGTVGVSNTRTWQGSAPIDA